MTRVDSEASQPPPRFSLLIPTRDRLPYLRYAVETVRRQDIGDWEVIIQDNASADDVEGWVRSLDDPRIRYARSERPLPVTENWNRALERARGEYVVMLGDDDALTPGYLSRLGALVDRFGAPDVVYTGAFHLAYPGVFPTKPDGFLWAVTNCVFFRGRREPFVLSPRVARRCVEGALRFRRPFAFNMQHFALRRSLIQRVRAATGTFFESPYPDFYAACAVFLLADRIVAVPEPWIIIGITPRSYGYYFFNDWEAEGGEFLRASEGGDASTDPGLLPGSDMNTNWLHAMAAVVRNFGREFGLSLHRRRYRLVQTLEVARRGRRAERTALRARLAPWERLLERVGWAAYRAHAFLPEAWQVWLTHYGDKVRWRLGNGYRIARDLGAPGDAVAAFELLERSMAYEDVRRPSPGAADR